MTESNTQIKLILAHLESGGTLTQADAAKLFNCWRLGARIKDLRDEGHPIITTMVSHGKGRHARYSLPQETTK